MAGIDPDSQDSPYVVSLKEHILALLEERDKAVRAALAAEVSKRNLAFAMVAALAAIITIFVTLKK